MTQSRFMEARNAAHHAAQVVSALGATHLPPDPDTEHSNLGWDARLEALVGRPAAGLAAGLRLRDLTWFLLRGQEILAERGATGSTLAEGLQWLREAATAAGATDKPLAPMGFELPDHPVIHGAPFPEVDPEQLVALARWFSVAHTALREVAVSEPNATEVRCWPHHFDIATLIRLEPEAADPEKAKSVGAGMTPGDAGIPEAYFYVTPWPYPAERQEPQLSVGHWHTQGWFGAVLTASEWDDTEEAVRSFLQSAVAAGRGLVDGA
ncbi:MAG: hypothetical protein KTR31_05275 [Myxococcales bacterium]|nr:hypothetical protein [Myxococcales bacterium]